MDKPTGHTDAYFNEVVSEFGYTRQELLDAFDMVHDPSDWKAPINKVIPGDPETICKVREAVMFYTGTSITRTPMDDGRCQVEAAGYRMGPCGDF